MTTQERKERIEEMINREYADLSAETRRQMIAAEWRSIEEKAWNAHVKANPVQA